MTNEMVMFSNGEITFMYRVGGIAVHEGLFEAKVPNLVYQWLPLDEVEEAELFPRFLRQLVRDIPQTPKYVVESEFE